MDTKKLVKVSSKTSDEKKDVDALVKNGKKRAKLDTASSSSTVTSYSNAIVNSGNEE